MASFPRRTSQGGCSAELHALCFVSGVGLGAPTCIWGGGRFCTLPCRPLPAGFLPLQESPPHPLGYTLSLLWCLRVLVVCGLFSLLSAMHPEELTIPGWEPSQEGFVLRPRSLISSPCSRPELLSTLIWCHCPPLQDELTLLLYPAHFFPRLGPWLPLGRVVKDTNSWGQ